MFIYLFCVYLFFLGSLFVLFSHFCSVFTATESGVQSVHGFETRGGGVLCFKTEQENLGLQSGKKNKRGRVGRGEDGSGERCTY